MIIPINDKYNPVDKALKEINEQSKNNLFLVGKSGYGKTKVLEKLKEQRNDKVILDGTISPMNYSFISNKQIHDLYVIGTTLKEVLKYIKVNYEDKYGNDFILLNKIIDDILKKIDDMKIVQDYTSIDVSLDFLIKRLVDVIKDYFETNDITLIIDDFDVISHSSVRYQKLIYYTLQKYVKLILTISDKNVYENKARLNELALNNDIVILDYSLNDEEVYNIILSDFDIASVLSLKTISKIINVTDGNLNYIFQIMNYLKRNMLRLEDNDYDSFILNYLDEYQEDIKRKYPALTRKLHI